MAYRLISRAHDSQTQYAPSAAKADRGSKPLIAAVNRCVTQKQLRWGWLAGLALLCALPLAAQVEYGNLHAGANGYLTAGYTGSNGNLQTGTHSWDVGGNGTITGYYYNPQFLSFNVEPYYGRSQDNSESQSITDSSGYVGTLNIFNGSHFPGFVSFNQNWNGSGTFGIPGVAGLTTKSDNHGLNIGWSAFLPNLPTLTLGYSDNAGSSSVLGSDSTSASTSRSFSAGSSYQLAGFYLNGGYNHVNTDAKITDLLGTGDTETTTDSSNRYFLNTSRRLPSVRSQLSFGVSRSTYSSDTSGVQNDGTTDSANMNWSLALPKLPVNVTATYTDNIFGSFQQQLINSGQAPVPGLVSPESRALTMMASTFYTVMPRLTVNGYVDHTENYFAGQTYGLTQFGINVNYNFLHRVKGLTFMAGIVDTANKEGNTRVGFVGNVNYHRAFGRWEVESYSRYDQAVQTLLVVYTTSNLNFGGSAKCNLGHGLRWIGIASGSHSVFEQQSGNGNQSQSVASVLLWRAMSLAANYSQSKGTSVLTANGLVQPPVPGQLISPGNVINYSSKNWGGTFRWSPTRNFVITTAYTKSNTNTVSPLLFANGATTNLYGFASYRLRKTLFSAGFTKFRQDISSSSTPPGVVTSYSFGVTRWFKGF